MLVVMPKFGVVSPLSARKWSDYFAQKKNSRENVSNWNLAACAAARTKCISKVEPSLNLKPRLRHIPYSFPLFLQWSCGWKSAKFGLDFWLQSSLRVLWFWNEATYLKSKRCF